MSEKVAIRVVEALLIILIVVLSGGTLGAFIGWITRKGNAKGQEHE